MPRPQERLQRVQPLHPVTRQVIGHFLVLQRPDVRRVGQPRPPYALRRVTTRVRYRVPPLQERLHRPQPLQPLTTQLIGQRLVLQLVRCFVLPHFFPPLAARLTIERERHL
jgi:hypothetical protein